MVNFGKMHLGTGFGKAKPAGDRQRDQPHRIPVTGSIMGTPIRLWFAQFRA
jgi:hypothetical protein